MDARCLCLSFNYSTEELTSGGQNFDLKPEVTLAVPTTGVALKPVGTEHSPEVTSLSPQRRSTSGRYAPPSPLIRHHSSSAATTVVADVHRDAAAHAPWTTSGPPPPRPRDHHRPEVAAPRPIPQRQRLAAPEDRRFRVPRHPVMTEFSAAAQQDRRQWSSLEHGVVDARRADNVERTTRRVRSYEDRYLLQRQPGVQSVMVMPHVRRRLPNANDPLRITEFQRSTEL